MAFVITIDGPVSSGKGTVARRVAAELGWHLLDSGSLYRLLGLYASQQGIELSDESALEPLAASLPVEFIEGEDELKVLLAGKDVSVEIRTEQVGGLASQVAVHPLVRKALLTRQRSFRQEPGLVADGRDMGTVVFADAPLKIYLTASAEERAQRRYKQLIEKGLSANLAALIDEIRERDARDMSRAVAPLEPAVDAFQIDSTRLTVEQVVALILNEAAARQLV